MRDGALLFILYFLYHLNFSNLMHIFLKILSFKKINYFIYLFLAALGLCCCMWAFSSCSEQGLCFVAVRCVASHCCGFSCCGELALGSRASEVVACRLSSCGAWA